MIPTCSTPLSSTFYFENWNICSKHSDCSTCRVHIWSPVYKCDAFKCLLINASHTSSTLFEYDLIFYQEHSFNGRDKTANYFIFNDLFSIPRMNFFFQRMKNDEKLWKYWKIIWQFGWWRKSISSCIGIFGTWNANERSFLPTFEIIPPKSTETKTKLWDRLYD